MQTDTPPAPPAPARKYGPVTVADLTIGQIERFYSEGYALDRLPEILDTFEFFFDPQNPGSIVGVMPWCNVYGLMTPAGTDHLYYYDYARTEPIHRAPAPITS